MLHTLVEYWRSTFWIGNLLVATLMLLFALAVFTIVRRRRTSRQAKFATLPVVITVWWCFFCLGSTSHYSILHPDGPRWIQLLGPPLTLITGVVLIWGAEWVYQSFRRRASGWKSPDR